MIRETIKNLETMSLSKSILPVLDGLFKKSRAHVPFHPFLIYTMGNRRAFVAIL